MRVLPAIMPFVARLRLMCPIFHRIRGGAPVPHMLFAGGGADYAPSAVGAFMFIFGHSFVVDGMEPRFR